MSHANACLTPAGRLRLAEAMTAAAKLAAGAQRAEDEQPEQPRQTEQPRRERHEKSVVEQVVGSSAFKQFVRSAGREIVRGIFGAARRRR
ncbi:MAG TPA: hypothetical protein VEK80_14685 [Kribbellaceae bacterium]|nr:hypothetical protein [Kribbellaceae bacterium]